MKALVLFAGIGQGIYCLLLFLTALFLILLILIQRGRGGGLSGAFGGGFGGQSAFGAKAGDTFTKVTIVAATFWIILCLVGVKMLGKGESVLGSASVNPPNITSLNPDIDVEATAGEGGAETAEGRRCRGCPTRRGSCRERRSGRRRCPRGE